MAFRLNYQVSVAWVPDGAAGAPPSTGGNQGCAPSMATANIQFFTPPTGIVVPFNGSIGSSPASADLTTAFNAISTALQAQITTAVLNRIQQFANGGN